ncbi:type 4 pilus major pilin [Pigmentiphaga sp.]|uniref:type 4 pilus major pilin n=1 Tax=Pigmentiphaga sp. TaxID=1977564 RepID=UPI00128DA076|nr:type 4 pilus major pilin [Pigmentiphaga sp.]MPS30691.1 pilus assembly protein [Alcaligenaceae bacterium SAGV5]MPS50633.1 pilus assembly protein [Alcaligenaceae bacterium SAGV3]MPT55607.1 pilus assembly protein [Alcaligenaceae bacterium]
MHVAKISNLHGQPIRSDNARQRQRGASLLEGIAYLGIAAIVVVGAISLLTGAFGSAKSNQSIEEVISLRTAVRKLYLGQAYPTTGVVQTLIAAKAVPGTLAVNTTTNTLTNSWRGSVTIAASSNGFSITYPAVPKEVCVGMLSGAHGWFSIIVNETDVALIPVTASEATTRCDTNDNTIIFGST